MNITAVIADDEPALAEDLRRRLARLWPELQVTGLAHDGEAALAAIRESSPAVVFLDIRMPGLTGLEVAGELPGTCHLVFVTAYDQYAVEAFERAAADYLLKPVKDDRLAETVRRLRRRMDGGEAPGEMTALLERVEALTRPAAPLQWIRASVGESVELVPVDEVRYFTADAKYTSVVTADREYLIRKPIKALEAELDGQRFWRIHRGTIVNAAAVASVSRNFRGRYVIRLKGDGATLTVSRSYAERFRQM
ncbi:response regulator transcription factor [Ectothiorhodospiraceae bacterium WFHF3C12]|nr:response regulator transcription factor [Ectothiorhodospiraceae bacterium WFHF3C12]